MATSEKEALSSTFARLAISKNSLRWRAEKSCGISRFSNGDRSARAGPGVGAGGAHVPRVHGAHQKQLV